MSSSQHSPRRSPSLRDASRRDLLAVLENNRQSTADVRPAVYVARVGSDVHLARNQGSDIVYRVGGPSQSFKPGTIVLLGSNTGRPGESIIALPSPAQKGASAYPESRFGGSIVFPEADEPPSLEPEPPIPTLSGLFGIYYNSSIGELHCWKYNSDGTFNSAVDTQSLDMGSDVFSINSFIMVGDTVEFTYNNEVSPFPRTSHRWRLLDQTLDSFTSTIDPESDTASNWHSYRSGAASGSIYYRAQLSTFGVSSGSIAYQIINSSSSVRGNRDFGTSWFSGYTVYKDIIGAGALCATGTLLMFEAKKNSNNAPTLFVLDVSDKSAVKHDDYPGVGTFTSNRSTATASNGVDLGGGRCVFLKSVTGQGSVAVLRDSNGTGDVQLWPDWDLAAVPGTEGVVPKPRLSLSPDKSQMVAYPFAGHTMVITASSVASVGVLDAIAVEAGPNGQKPHTMLWS